MIGRFLQFIIDNWRITIPLLIVGIVLLEINHLRGQRDNAITELKDYKIQLANQVAAAEQINLVALTKAKADLTELQIRHTTELQSILNQRKQDKSKEVANVQTNKTNSLLSDIATLRNQLRDQLLADNTQKSTPSSDTSRPTEEGRECDSTIARQYDTLKSACALTTSDFNYCRGILDAHCKQFECKDD